ncbi:MAG: PAS domain S-box protein, partial [Gammaproteobacteria bacterium]
METTDWFQQLSGPALMLRYADGAVAGLNAAAQQLFGADVQLTEGKTLSDLTLADGNDSVWQTLQRTLDLTGNFEKKGVHLRTEGGVLRRVDISAELVDAENERRVLLLLESARTDATATAFYAPDSAVHPLLSEDKYRSLVEHSQDGVFVIQEGLYVYVNQVYAVMLGYTTEEMIGESCLQFFAPEERQKMLDMWRERQAGNWERNTYEAYLLCKDGETRVLASVRSGPMHYAGATASIGTVRDITTYRNTEYRLHLAEQRFRDIVEYAVVGIYQSATDGRLLSANPALAHILGYESVSELKENVDNVRDVYIDTAERDRNLVQLEAEGSVVGSELKLRHRDGMELWVQDNARVVYDEAGSVICYEGMVEDI